MLNKEDFKRSKKAFEWIRQHVEPNADNGENDIDIKLIENFNILIQLFRLIDPKGK